MSLHMFLCSSMFTSKFVPSVYRLLLTSSLLRTASALAVSPPNRAATAAMLRSGGCAIDRAISRFPIEKPIPGHTESCSRCRVAQEHSQGIRPLLASLEVTFTLKSAAVTMGRRRRNRTTKSNGFALHYHCDIEDTLKWDEVLFSAEIQGCFCLLTWNIQHSSCTAPSGIKSLELIVPTTSDP